MTDHPFDHDPPPESASDRPLPPQDGAPESLEDTKPKAPAGLQEAARQSALYQQLAAHEPPIDLDGGYG